ncbi:hypothetical protein NQ318_022427 [Aromia moschata]|uniref:Uncharacterized protein n=1 Tax=Aromia moschata TaxID=1265417 RepID=A0AAV8Z547_9CUCU|nr:hypothetical protein NQ318_022427 [Aromia moschata]
MFSMSLLTIVQFIIVLNLASAYLLCYDCDAGLECEDPKGHHVRVANCDTKYPNAVQNNEKLICLTLGIKVLEGRGFGFGKSGFYRGCNVIPSSVNEEDFCEYFTDKHKSHRLTIDSCQFCNVTRCLPPSV